MPNWVSNTISVTAKSKAELDAFLEKAKGSQSKVLDERGNEFHFGAFVHPSDEDLPYYKGELEEEKPEGWDDLSSAEQMAHNLKFTGRGWYDWNVTNWGTKWDACDTYIGRDSDLEATITFQTAWGIPEPILHAVAEQHPELALRIWSEEEQGWGAEYHAEGGKLSLTKEWDIPTSHSEYAERDNEDSCICAYEDDKDEWYDDCPNKRDIFVQVTKVYRLSSSTIEDARTEYLEIEMGNKELPTEESDLASFIFVDEDGQPID
jgi:hypothetical protein